jgi:hypothetical protein
MSKGISLHIGLNKVDPAHYGGWSGPLNACEADAEDMYAIARDLGYKSTILKTSEATRKAITSYITEVASQLDGGDIFFFSYSGHGGQLPDKNGDEPDDFMDETWCLFDGQLVDDELLVFWSKFKEGVRIVVLSDSCHSGTVTRLAPSGAPTSVISSPVDPSFEGAISSGYRFRFAPDEVTLRTYRLNRDFYDDLLESIPVELPMTKATDRLISGCQDNQTSLDGAFNGLFTGTLLRVWDSGRFNGNYHEFHKAILKRMPVEQSPNHFIFGRPNPEFDAQKPFEI